MNIKDGSEIWLSLGYWARCLSEPQAQSLLPFALQLPPFLRIRTS